MDLFSTSLGQARILQAAASGGVVLGNALANLFTNNVPYNRLATLDFFQFPTTGGINPFVTRPTSGITVDGNGLAVMSWLEPSWRTTGSVQQVDEITFTTATAVFLGHYNVYGIPFPATGFFGVTGSRSPGTVAAIAEAFAESLNLPGLLADTITSVADGPTVTMTHNVPAQNDPTFNLQTQYNNVIGQNVLNKSVNVTPGSVPIILPVAAKGVVLWDQITNAVLGYATFPTPVLFNEPGEFFSVPLSLTWGS